MKSAGRPILAAISRRGYAAQAAAAAATAEQATFAAQKPRITRLASGTVIATLENYSPVARIAVFYNAGSRCENGSNLGATHAIRSASGLSTQHNSQFAITRNIQQIGGSMTCTTNRETMMYSVECLRNLTDTGFDFLVDVATSPAFKTWEVSALSSRLGLDMAMLEQQPQVQMMEGLHKAAFRNGLGNSLYSPANRIGSHTPEMLTEFVQKYFTSGNMAIVATGVDHDNLIFKCKKLTGAQGSEQFQVTKYFGGEFRVDTTSPLTHAAIVTQGVSVGSSDLVPLAVLQNLMGSGHYVKYGSNVATSKVSKAVSSGTSAPFIASCLNASYSDSGLFGFQVTAQSKDMGSVLPALVAAFSEATKGAFSAADVDRAKNQLRSAVAMELESGNGLLMDMGAQVLLNGSILSAADIDAAISQVSAADVQNIAKKVINNGKPTMSAIGNLTNTPYLDELL